MSVFLRWTSNSSVSLVGYVSCKRENFWGKQNLIDTSLSEQEEQFTTKDPIEKGDKASNEGVIQGRFAYNER